jgi:ferredoxin/flavodoxin
MKSALCYFSGSGQTKLACEYIVKKLPQVEFVMFNIAKDKAIDLSGFDFVGFAAWADFLGPSKLVVDFIRKLPQQNGKPAFVFNTYGNFNGGTLKRMAQLCRSRGFKVFAGHALHLPENIPTMIMMGIANTQAPDPGELDGFNRFVNHLGQLTVSVEALRGSRFRPSLLERIMPRTPRFLGRLTMGKKSVDKGLCTSCGLCEKGCPYKAIVMRDGNPVFDEKKCFGCWACYNHCPTKAIYTKKYRGVGHYPAPIEAVKEKLKG